MSEYIVTCDEETASWIGNEVDSMNPIVRCRDCAFFREKDWRCTSYQWLNCDESPEVEPDGFCAWGDRREDA